MKKPKPTIPTQYYHLVVQLERTDKNRAIAQMLAQAIPQIARAEGAEGKINICKLEALNIVCADALQ
jgi:hypothetical protein